MMGLCIFMIERKDERNGKNTEDWKPFPLYESVRNILTRYKGDLQSRREKKVDNNDVIIDLLKRTRWYQQFMKKQRRKQGGMNHD